MLQSDYDNLQVVPVYVLLGLVYLSPYVLFFICRSMTSKRQWVTSLKENLGSLYFQILFSDEKLKEAREEFIKKLRGLIGWHEKSGYPTLRRDMDARTCRCLRYYILCFMHPDFIRASYTTLPLMFFVMAISMFWTTFIVYETDHNCNPNDQKLECFSNSSGPLSCEAVLGLENSTYVCYKLSFAFTDAAAAMLGTFTISFIVVALLGKFFTFIRHTCTSCWIALFVQLVTFFVAVTGCVLYILYVLREPAREVDKVLHPVFISYIISLCCFSPWCFINPEPRDSNMNVQE